jgi:GntR family transcriptional repressor for pyruvate dehydrogenase complex
MTDPGLEPIRRSPLYEEVAQRVRSFIEGQDLKPGDRLMAERELAQRLGVSRTSVRQALTALRVSGLVDIRHGDGVYLLRVPDHVVPSVAHELVRGHSELPATMEVREALETQTARLAARRRSDADLKELRATLVAMGAAIEAGEDGAAADRAFHAAVAHAAHNELLANLLEQISGPVEETRRASLAEPGRPTRSLAAHGEIVAAIDGHDEEGAAQAMRDHLRMVGDIARVGGLGAG